MKPAAPALKHVIAVVLATMLALLARAWLQLELQASGLERRAASDLAFLVVAPLLLALLLPVLRTDRHYLASRFQRLDLSLRVGVIAVLIGVFIRVAWWGQLIARVAVGWQANESADAVTGPGFNLDCPEPQALLLGIVVTAGLIPLFEETTHRGYVQAHLHRRAPMFSIPVASTIFMAFHLYEGWLFAFASGLVLGTLYRVTGSLWAPVICHAVVNLVPQFTWRCLNPAWNPDPESLPLWLPAVLGSLAFAGSAAGIIALLRALDGRRDTGSRRPAPLKGVSNPLDDV